MTNAIEFLARDRTGQKYRISRRTDQKLKPQYGIQLQRISDAFRLPEGDSIRGQATRDIFDAVGIAATVMNLSAEQSEGAF